MNQRELESQRLELYHANQWADQAQREKTISCGNEEKHGIDGAQWRIIAEGFGFVVSTDSSVIQNTSSHAHFSQCRALDHRSSHALACGSSLGCGAPLRIFKVINPLHVLHVSSTTLMCLAHFFPYVHHHLRLHRPTLLPMTGIRRSPCATPHGGLEFGRLVEPTPLTGNEPIRCIDVSSELTPINYSSRRNSFNTDYNDFTTTVAASETPDMKEVWQSISPLLFQEREVSSNPLLCLWFPAASGSQR